MTKIISVHYVQSLNYAAGAPHWGEELDLHIQIGPDFFQSGWYLKKFGGRTGPLDWLVFQAILLHTRPLNDAELKRLTHRGLATPGDAGRLLAGVTHAGLADELGNTPRAIAAASARLLDLRRPGGRLLKIFWQDGATLFYVLSAEAQKLMQ